MDNPSSKSQVIRSDNKVSDRIAITILVVLVVVAVDEYVVAFATVEGITSGRAFDDIVSAARIYVIAAAIADKRVAVK